MVNLSYVYFVYFVQALDNVNCGIFLSKLELYGVQDIALKQSDSYVFNQLQYVTYKI